MISDALEIVDVNDPALVDDRESLLSELVPVHSRHFPAYPQVMDEVVEHLQLPQTVPHAWLLRVDGRPAGEFLFHTCLRRRIVQIHYVAMDPQARSVLPRGWLADVTDAALAASRAEAAEHGVALLAMAGEMFSTPADYRRWRRKGFLILALDYREPVGGRRWPHQEPVRFNRLTLGVRLTDAGRECDPTELLYEVLSSFLLDYYDLPADHPEVVRVFAEAQEMGLRELSDEVIHGHPA